MRLFLIASLVFILAFPASAQQPRCLPHDAVVKTLNAKHGEVLTIRMLSSDGRLVEIFVNHETETWTVVSVFPGGKTCPMGAGTNYTVVDTPKGEAS